ncbi:DinB family protein [Marixanthomonas ophiurae]|uniref:DinB family protein n=1 Tax=Marixanthomonas ophiurae TaxID=387659 RepID=A0A3E1Q866_9FLAO|nr:DinB family protein [Marixanthomonas ophiurae]RFN58312.1 DinB family protein [Marixanthomonas ophiurae]
METTIPTSHYHSYFKRYIDLVVEHPLKKALKSGISKSKGFYESLPEDIWAYQYAEGKWTPKEVLLHVIDTERVFSYRALQIARSNQVKLKGYDENLFAKNSNANNRSIKSLISEYVSVRAATIALFESFSEDILNKIGTADGKPLSVIASGYIICGHDLHHINIIKERYI